MRELLEQLCALRGVSGDEGRIAAFITKQIDGRCEWRIDALGSVIACVKGKKTPRNKVLFCAGMDEAGFIVTGHTDEGLLKFDTVGAIDSRVIIGKPVLAGDAGLPGIVGAKPVHMMTAAEKDTPLKVEKLYLDLGFSSRGEAEKTIHAGERAVFDLRFLPFGDGLLKGRAIAERACCAALIELIRSEPEYDVTVVFAAQGITGGAGARVAAYAVAPDYAVTVEAVVAADIPGVPEEKQVSRLGQGPALGFMDRGAFYDVALYRLALKAAEETGIPAQSKLGILGGGSAKAIQTARGGVRCAGMGIPCRYPYTPNSVVKEVDIHSTARLLQMLAARVAEL